MTSDAELDAAAARLAGRLDRMLLELADRDDPHGSYLTGTDRTRLERRIEAQIGPKETPPE